MIARCLGKEQAQGGFLLADDVVDGDAGAVTQQMVDDDPADGAGSTGDEDGLLTQVQGVHGAFSFRESREVKRCVGA